MNFNHCHLFNLLDILQSSIVIVEEKQGLQAAELHLVHLCQYEGDIETNLGKKFKIFQNGGHR